MLRKIIAVTSGLVSLFWICLYELGAKETAIVFTVMLLMQIVAILVDYLIDKWGGE